MLLFLLATSVSVGGQQSPPQRAPQAVRTGVELILVDANVVDGSGRPVSDLRPDEFTLTVDGKPRPLASTQFVWQGRTASPRQEAAPPRRYFSSNQSSDRTFTPPAGRIFLFVIDQGNLSFGGAKSTMAAARRFLDRLTPEDRVGLASIPRGGPSMEFTRDHARVREALGRVTGYRTPFSRLLNVSLSEAFAIDDGDQSTSNQVYERECVLNAHQNPTQTVESQLQACRSELTADAQSIVQDAQQRTRDSMAALRSLVTALGRLDGSKTLVLVSEAMISGGTRFFSEFTSAADSVAVAAARSRVTIYVLRVDRSSADFDASAQAAPTTPGQDEAMRRNGLDIIAGTARGAAFSIVGTGDAALQRLELETSGYYLLGVEPIETDRDGKPHKIGVAVARTGLTVRARREFSIVARPTEAAVKPEEEVAAMLGSSYAATDLPLRVSTYAIRDSRSSKLRIIVAADIDQDRTEPAEYTVGLILRDRQDRVPANSIERKMLGPLDPSRPGPAVYTVAEVVDPGSYTLKLAATDASGRRGSVEHPVAAQLASAEGLQVSDLLVADRPPQAGGTWRPAIEAVAQDAMTGYVEVYSADRGRLRQTTVSFEVAADEKSPALVSVDSKVQETKQADRSVAEGKLPLGLLPPGEYLARAVVSLSGRPVTSVFRPVRVARTVPALAAGVNRPLDSPAQAIVGTSSVEPFRPGLVLDAATVGHFLDRLVTLSPAPPSANVRKAIDEARAGRFDAAVDALKGAGQGDLGATFIRGLALLSQRKLEEAANQFRASLKISSTFIPAIVYLGACYAIGGHDRDAAGAWQSSLLTENDAQVVYRILGDALLRLGDGEQARDVLLEAALAWPDDDDLKRRLAAAYMITGQPKEALAALDPYLAHHPDDDRALYLAMGLVYVAYAEGRTVEGPAEDALRISRYQQLYAAARGPQQHLVTEWVRFVGQQK